MEPILVAAMAWGTCSILCDAYVSLCDYLDRKQAQRLLDEAGPQSYIDSPLFAMRISSLQQYAVNAGLNTEQCRELFTRELEQAAKR